jgi:3-oxoacyl-[acyl-carrier-protein] synthase-3
VSAGVALQDIDLFVFHQANARITRALGERLELPAERVVDNIAELGNTSAASIPLALEQARDDGRLQAGSRVLICAVGSGFIWGAALLEWGRA